MLATGETGHMQVSIQSRWEAGLEWHSCSKLDGKRITWFATKKSWFPRSFDGGGDGQSGLISVVERLMIDRNLSQIQSFNISRMYSGGLPTELKRSYGEFLRIKK